MNFRIIALPVVLVVIVYSIFYLDSMKNKAPEVSVGPSSIIIGDSDPAVKVSDPESSREMRVAGKSLMYPGAFEISTPDNFINTKEFKLGDFVGKKVILLDFWTYSCINCQRTIPYLNSWNEKYSDKGLLIVGLHTPEFEFEKVYDNVAAAVKKFGIKYPVVLDNDYSTWTSYRNQYWPRKYLIDIDGFVVYDHIGEGGYEETEKRIQSALEERRNVLGLTEESLSGSVALPLTEERFYTLPNSPEVYFGAFRNNLLSNGVAGVIGTQNLSAPEKLETNRLYLSGGWNFEREYAANNTSGAKIIFKYRANDVYFVASAEKSVNIKILRDGKDPGVIAGEDVDSEGRGSIGPDRLYKLIQDPDGQAEHTIEIQIEDPGLKAFTFTFG